ncbi:MAG: ABC transporter permease [Planctomycetes bacterium]|nr:ABC transporter permease [Planctomycetota bacterium]
MKLAVLAALLVLEAALFAAIGGFPASASLKDYVDYGESLLVQSCPILLLAFGMTIVISTAGIDLSVGSMTALVACVMAVAGEGATFWATAVPAGLAVALLAGLANGATIALLDVPPIIATLGTMILYRGLCWVTVGDREMDPFFDVRHYEHLGEPLAALVLVALVYGGGTLYFGASRWRREVLMLGGNRVAARYAGVPVVRRTLEVYALVGLLAFLAAVTFTARQGSVTASALAGLELKVIVAVVLGGTRVEGGSASVLGSLLGVAIIAVLDEGLRGAKRWGDEHLPFEVAHLRFVSLGLLLAAGVWLNARFAGRPGRRRSRKGAPSVEAPR